MLDLTTALYGAVAALAAFYVLKYLYWKLFIDRGDDIETYASIPLLGVPKDKIKSLHTLTVDDVRKKGPIYRRVNALKPWAGAELVVADPNMLKDIFVGKNWQKFDRGHPVAESFFPYSGGLIHARNDDTWRELRAIYDRTFSTVNVRKLMPIMIDLRDILMTQLEKGTKEHPEGIDLYSYFHAFTFDMITRLAFGAQVNAQTTETGMHYAKQFEKWQENATVMFLIRSLAGKWAFPMISKIVDDWKANGECMYGLLDDERDRVKRGEGRPSILNDLYTLIKEEKMSKNVTEDVIRSANMTLLFGGHDTTAALLGFLAYELSKRPDIQAQIRAEVKEVFGNNNIDNLEELEKCKVLTASIKETLRKYPSAPGGAGRVVLEPFTFEYTGVDGKQRRINFKKWDTVNTNLYAIQNLETYWAKDPKVWEPSRFYEQANGDTTNLFCFSPFGNGARRCLGERLAYGEARLTIASILRKWQINHIPETNWKMAEIFSGTIKPSNVMVTLTEVKQ